MGRYDRTLRERFDEKWIPEPNTGCWLWIAGGDRDGYGLFRGNASGRAHRVAWELYRGPIPDGLVIDHICRTKAPSGPIPVRGNPERADMENEMMTKPN